MTQYSPYVRSSGTPYMPGATYSGPTRSGGYTKTPKDILEHLAAVRAAANLPDAVRGKPVPYGNAPANNPANEQEAAGNQLTPFTMLMAAAQNGGGAVDLSMYNRELRQSRAQTAENQGDIGSWYGQLSGMYGKAGKADKRASRRGVKDAKNFNRSLIGGQADKGVAYALGLGGQAEGNYLLEQGQNQAAFDRRMGADAVAQGNYQKMVQARLGAQERAGIRSERAQAAQSSQGEGWDRMMQVLGLMSQEQRDAYLSGQPGAAAGPEGADFNNMRDALGESADSMFGSIKTPEGNTVDQYTGGLGGFPQALAELRSAATSSGLNLADPRIREAFRAWVAGNFQSRYNQATPGPNYFLSGQSFRQEPQLTQ
jgi:hypothetical protein